METIKVETYTDLGNEADYMHWLKMAERERREAEEHIVKVVLGARAQGASWAKIGNELGISKQAAQKKYGQYEAVRPNIKLFQEAPTVRTAAGNIELGEEDFQ